MYRLFLKVAVNDLPTTKIEGSLKTLPFGLQLTVDYLRRNAVFELNISDEEVNNNNNKLLDNGREFDDLHNDVKKELEKQEAIKKTYSDKDRQLYDQAAAKMEEDSPYNLCQKFLKKDERFIVLCNEIGKSASISQLTLNYIKYSENNLKFLIQSILNNANIKKVSLIHCDEKVNQEIKNAIQDLLESGQIKLFVDYKEINKPAIDLDTSSEIKNEKRNDHKGYSNYSFLMNCLTVGVTSLALAVIFTLALSPMAGIAIGITGGAAAFFTLNHLSFFQEPGDHCNTLDIKSPGYEA